MLCQVLGKLSIAKKEGVKDHEMMVLEVLH
jgi:hypothetical protein